MINIYHSLFRNVISIVLLSLIDLTRQSQVVHIGGLLYIYLN